MYQSVIGWLTFAKFGLYSVVKFGTALMFLSSLAVNIVALFFDKILPEVIIVIIFTLLGEVFLLGGFSVFVTILQFGLDQMPNASSSHITSFIMWLIFCCCAGIWISDVWYTVYQYSGIVSSKDIQVWCLLTVVSLAIILASHLILKTDWLIVNKPNPSKVTGIKIVYHVLKFAAKHKAPLNRSALTYWEENIPSRIDLGKSRYGGPFTTEQVEDVKTALRLFVVSLAFWVISFGIGVHPVSKINILSDSFPNMTVFSSQMIVHFTFDNKWSVLIATVLIELVLYPLIGHKLPSIMKRIGIISFWTTIVSILCLTLELVNHNIEYEIVTAWITNVLNYTSSASIFLLLGVILEFICAQAPYNMKGFFTGYIVVIFFTTLVIGNVRQTNEHIIIYGVKSGVSLFGFIFYCLLARWYKRRVRDEEYNVHRVVEEVYDRYLSAIP